MMMMLTFQNKFYPREFDKNVKGRVRVQLRNDDGTPVLEQFPTSGIIFCCIYFLIRIDITVCYWNAAV